MSELRLYVYSSGTLVNDPERAMEYAQGLSFNTHWPKGYGSLSCQVARDIVATWAVKMADEIVVRDGLKIVYQGRINNLVKSLSQAGEMVRMTAGGWYQVLNERRIRMRWVDNEPISRMRVPAALKTSVAQMNMDATILGDEVTIRGGYGDVNHEPDDAYYLRYTMPTGIKVHKITSSYACRSGEGIQGEWYNTDGAGSEIAYNTSDGAEHTGSLNTTSPLTNGNTETVAFIVTLTTALADTYDENDRFKMYDAVIFGRYHASHADWAAPSYTVGEIVEDVLIRAASAEISADYDEIAEPGVTLDAFTTQGDDFETADSIIQRLAGYGDASDNTYGLCIWDETGTSDGLPKATFEARSVSDYEWIVSLTELDQFEDEPSDDELYNWVIVKYTDDEDLIQYLTPDDDATLTDATSVASYGTRHSPVIDIGKGNSTRAQNVGQRYLAYHKDPLHRMSASIKSQIKNKQGVWLPAAWVRAGQRVKVAELDTIYFLRYTNYEAESETLRMDSDLSP